MKFVLVGPASPLRGGIAQYNDSLGVALSERASVRIVSFSRQYPSFLFPGRSQLENSHNGTDYPAEALLDSCNPLTWRATGRRIERAEPDAVIFQWWHPFFVGVYHALVRRLKRRGIAALMLCHNVYPHERIAGSAGLVLERSVIRPLFRKMDGFLVHSSALAEQVRELSPAARIRQIYHPVYDFYSQWDRPVEESPGSPVRLLFFGKIRPYKGLDTLIDALGLLRDRIDFQATIAGEFYVDPAPFKRKVAQYGLQERVCWESRYIAKEEVPALFREADLVVLPYRNATQSGVVPLAYQFEVPVIATDVGGLSEVVLEGKTGFLARPDDAEHLAELIVKFVERDNKRDFQAEIREFRPRLSWKQVIDEIFDLLTEFRQSPAGASILRAERP